MKKIIYFFAAISLMYPSRALAICNRNIQNIPGSIRTIKDTLSPGRVIVVTGSCSSGKSSMAKIIAEKLNAQSFAFDEYAMPKILEKFIQKHYGKFLAFFISGIAMRNFFTSIDFLSEKRKYELQKKFYKDLREGLAVKPTAKLYCKVRDAALKGKNVVVEAPFFLWEDVDCLNGLEALNGLNITYVLAYCPWNDLVDRIKERNASQNKKIHRELDWALINFIHTFEVSSDYRGGNCLEYLSGRDVHSTIKEYAQLHYKKKHLHILKETETIAKKAFSEHSSYYIYPRFAFDITVNTKTHTPMMGADVVINYIQKYNAFNG